jgi:hypothetical protein
MPTKPIDRLLFAQGGLCFFCQRILSPADASVEHLVATTNGGSNNPDNTVACCKALNTLLGRMSLKEKLRVFLNQKGEFKCPNDGDTVVSKVTGHQTAAQRLDLVINNLRKRGTTCPRTIQTLSSTIGAMFQKKLTEQELGSLIAKLQAQGIVLVNGTKVSYALPPSVV